jgi:hypothetical protein
MRRLAIALVLALAACGSTEPQIDPCTAPIAGVYDLASQLPTNPQGVFIPDTQPWIQYSSDSYTFSAAGSWSRAWAGNSRLGSSSTPTSGSDQGTFTRNCAQLVLQANGSTYLTTIFTGVGFSYKDQYFTYTFARR